MVHRFSKEKYDLEQRFVERKRLLVPFIKRYKHPVLVHGIYNKTNFKKILQAGCLKIPKNHTISKDVYMEHILGIDNSIFYSVGFVYFTAYGWKYNLIFDIGYLNECTYYENPVNYGCYKAVIDYWIKNDKKFLSKLEENTLFKDLMIKYRSTDVFEYWKIEQYTFENILKYSKHKTLMLLIKKTASKYYKNHEKSIADVKKYYLTKVPEVICFKNNDLLKNKYFLGFFIEGKVSKDIKTILKIKYPDKILFDGKKILSIAEL